MECKAVVIGTSSGGMHALMEVLKPLPKDFAAPIVIVQHISPHSSMFIVDYLKEQCSIEIKEADEKVKIRDGCAYIAPPNYHLLIEKDGSLSLTVGEKVCYARPSIDVLFETAADAYGEKLIGIILTGANSDGSKGLARIKEKGGLAIVQDPREAEADIMPQAAIAATTVDYILELNRIGILLRKITGGNVR